MDWADDIAYSVHDMFDFYKCGLIPLDQLHPHLAQARTSRKAWDPIIERANKQRKKEGSPEIPDDHIAKFFDWTAPIMPMEPYSSSREHRGIAKAFASNLISRYVGEMTELTSEGSLKIDPQAKSEVEILKQLTWHYVIENPALIAVQEGQRRCLAVIIESMIEDADREGNLFPENHKEMLSNNCSVGRVVADYVSSLTERQAYALYRKLMGISETSILEVISI